MVILELQPNTHRTKIRIKKNKNKQNPVNLRNYWDTTRSNERKSTYPNSSISISLTYPSLKKTFKKKHHAWIVHELISIDFYWHLSTYERFLIHRTVVEGFLRFLPLPYGASEKEGVGEPVG